jgi:Helix-turn-helix domain
MTILQRRSDGSTGFPHLAQGRPSPAVVCAIIATACPCSDTAGDPIAAEMSGLSICRPRCAVTTHDFPVQQCGLGMSPARFSMKLKRLRESRGMTQQTLAQKSGISRGYLARLEWAGTIASESAPQAREGFRCERGGSRGIREKKHPARAGTRRGEWPTTNLEEGTMGKDRVASQPRPLNDIILELECLAIDADRLEKIMQVAEDLRHRYAAHDSDDQRSRVIQVLHDRAVSDAGKIRRRLQAVAAELQHSKAAPAPVA